MRKKAASSKAQTAAAAPAAGSAQCRTQLDPLERLTKAIDILVEAALRATTDGEAEATVK